MFTRRNSVTINGLGLLILALSASCAAVLASRQPNKHDMEVLSPGVARTHVIAELGPPVWSDSQAGQQVDVFTFRQGYAKSTKAARALVHGAADVATFGLWEVVGVPFETLADGTDVQLEVHYDAEEQVDKVVVIKGDGAVHPRKIFSRPRKVYEDERPDNLRTAARTSPPAVSDSGEED